ncbi:DMT family transporter [Photobacterium sp. WH77]|uniref:DMT family transporter n=1 Tax=unclassified Photobacterium TaxID=2628852 RepID=UPI001C4629E9|nr:MULTISPECIES: DMT family transporter [unclassified Photobacterium]MBV7263487.1 DMT family transporter [Photobacterium sp. WH24]MCG2838721.1 DMT family transporter [Photobacterium sp. WH77]MCG2846358.1 DMT family transporter [Photobacterium sp. WH80]
MIYLFPLLTVSIWAGNAIVNKLSYSVIDPGAIAFYRWFFAMLALTPFVITSVIRQWSNIKPHLSKLALLAFLGMVLNQSLGYFAAPTTTATNMALIMSLVPLMSMFLSVPILKQKLSPLAMVGAVLSLGGLVLMLSHGDPSQLLAQGINQGDGLLLLAAFVYALYCVLLKRWDMPLSNWQSVYVQGMFAVLFLLPMLFTSQRVAITGDALPLVLFAAIPASVIAPWCWMKGIKMLGADKTAMFMNLMPVITAIIASVVLNEQLEAVHLIGGGMVLCGVAVAQLRLKARRSKLVTA